MSADPQGDRRAEIIDAAARVISTRGVDAARIADIAEEAGVSIGLVQHYFRHRDRLLAEVFRREAERIAGSWQTLVDPGSPPLERLVDYLRICTPDGAASGARSFGPAWAFWLELWSKAHREPTVRAEVESIYASFAEPFAAAIADGVEQGVFQPPSPVEDIVDRLVSQIDGVALRTLLGALEESRMFTLLVDSLCLELGLSDELAAAARAHAARVP